MERLFHWLDTNRHKPSIKLLNQIIPIVVCLSLFAAFMGASYFFIVHIINPSSTEKIQIHLYPVDVVIGFFLYFVTAVDYALIVGRMQISNPGSKARFAMNVFTCIGCFVGVSLVLFLWGFAKEIPLLIIPILIFAGSVMIKLAYEGIEYYEHEKTIPQIVRKVLAGALRIGHYFTTIFTFWIPELGSPHVQKMSIRKLAQWSFFLPFIIGTDDLVGYMGAMTIYNVFSLLFGIYLADILIDILIFVSPSLTKKIVENVFLSVLAGLAFIFLAYKSYSEAFLLMHEKLHLELYQMGLIFVVLLFCGFMFSVVKNKRVRTS